MLIEKSTYEGIYQGRTRHFTDNRGRFDKLFDADILKSVPFFKGISQVNMSFNELKGTVRGMHYQTSPSLDAKIIIVLEGTIFDVVVDLRNKSKNFLSPYTRVLSAEEDNVLIIDSHNAHGFQTLDYKTRVLYIHSGSYSPNDERGIRADDPMLDIAWPLPFVNLSERDKNFSYLTEKFTGLET